MKHLLVLILTSLFLLSSANADLIRKIEDDNFYVGTFDGNVALLCIKGYLWIFTQHFQDSTMTQFMMEKDGHAIPAKC